MKKKKKKLKIMMNKSNILEIKKIHKKQIKQKTIHNINKT